MTQTDPSFCPDCGTAVETRVVEERERAYCPDCERVVWVNPVPCAGVAVHDGDSLLLVERAVPPGVGEWTVPGGHLERDEPPAVGAARELAEETGLAVDPEDLELTGTALVGAPPGKTVLTLGYAVERSATRGTLTAGSDASACRFWAREELHEGAVALRPFVAEHLDTLYAP